MTNKPLILCAVSGGADSICMLHLLHSRGERVACAHYNHGMRGETADSDEQFVRRFCESLSIPFYTEKGDVYGEAERTGEGVEECGRRLRYEFFERAAEKLGADLIATAHNADDQSETVLMRLVRGAGSLGLSGIPEQRGNIIRPILHMSRAEIEAYIAEKGLEYIYDSTNSDDRYVRNLLRHQVMPVLKDINPNLNETFSRAARIAAQDEEFLSSLAADFMEKHGGEDWVNATELSILHRAVGSRVVRLLAAGAGLTLSEGQVVAALELAGHENPSASMDVRGGKIWRSYEKLCVGIPVTGAIEGETPVAIPGETSVPGTDIKIFTQIVPFDENVQNSFNTFYFKDSIINCNPVVRSRIAGETIALPGRKRRSLKKLMCDLKLPAQGRELIPVVSVKGQAAAVMDVGAEESFLAEKGETAVMLRFARLQEQGGTNA
ncbi:MAG: tRNA lysidine(34) synthetase TilS [Oscillospiraceae bacterium]|nr:tRNA lysidine(34) synthetase TilS [Oscillospiraceae bacterium]